MLRIPLGRVSVRQAHTYVPILFQFFTDKDIIWKAQSLDKSQIACIINSALYVLNKQLFLKVHQAKGSGGTFFRYKKIV